MNEGACSSWSEEPLSPANQSGASSEADLSTDDGIDVLNENTNDLQLRFANSEEIKRDHCLLDERRYEKLSVHPPFLQGGFSLQPNFQKWGERGGGGWLDRTSTFRGGLLGKRG